MSANNTANSPPLFCFSLGYTTQALARQLLAQAWRVSGTCRYQAKADLLRQQGIKAYVFSEKKDLANPTDCMRGVTHLLSSIPPDASGEPVIHRHGEAIGEGLKTHPLSWIGYLSTIGVYGDQQGRWIDEECPTSPISKTSERRVVAEQQWLDFGRLHAVPAHIFRLPGIYGPNGRSQLDALRAGHARRIVKPGQVFNRIHVNDLARVVIASMHKPGGSAIYNVTDNEPAPAHEVVAYAAKLLGIDAPPEIAFEDADLSPFAAHFYAECKRVRNDRIKQELGVELEFPTYRQGLAAILAEES